MKNVILNNLLKMHSLPLARLLSWSKSEYRAEHPKNVCYFNANIVTARDGKVWFGDLDLTQDALTLKIIAQECGETLYILKEMDCRFSDESKDGVVLIGKAVWDTTQSCPTKD